MKRVARLGFLVIAGLAVATTAMTTGRATWAASSRTPTDFTGTWSGPVTQVGRSDGYTVRVVISAGRRTTAYPELNCSGELTPVGASDGYAFYTETITRGKADAEGKTGCIEGSITLARTGDKLIWSWFGVYSGEPVLAYATLAKSPEAAPPPEPSRPSATKPRKRKH